MKWRFAATTITGSRGGAKCVGVRGDTIITVPDTSHATMLITRTTRFRTKNATTCITSTPAMSNGAAIAIISPIPPSDGSSSHDPRQRPTSATVAAICATSWTGR